MNTLTELLSEKNINFLIGSGASSPLYPTLSLGNNLPSFEDFLCSEKLLPQFKKILYCYYYAKWISPMQWSKIINKKEDSEYKNVSKAYEKFIELILEILNNESNERPKRANIFTTNYDLLFEINFDDINTKNPLCFFNDGSRGFISRTLKADNFYLNVSHSGYYDNYKYEVPTINLFKIHGSVSWNKKDDDIIINHPNEFLKELDDLIEAIDNFNINNIDEIFKSFNPEEKLEELTIELNNRLTLLDIDDIQIDNFYNNYIKLAIINPNKWKFHDTVYEQHYYQLIRSFSYEMEKKNTVLVVFAFSFADEHLFDIFRRSLLNPTLQVIMISFSEDNQRYMKEKFIGFNNIIYYPKNFKNHDGSIIRGNFEFLNNLLRGQIE